MIRKVRTGHNQGEARSERTGRHTGLVRMSNVLLGNKTLHTASLLTEPRPHTTDMLRISFPSPNASIKEGLSHDTWGHTWLHCFTMRITKTYTGCECTQTRPHQGQPLWNVAALDNINLWNSMILPCKRLLKTLLWNLFSLLTAS